jgi:maltose O-acetyltransferase
MQDRTPPQHEPTSRLSTTIARIWRAAREDVANLHARSLLAHAISAALPQLTFNRARTFVLRRGGLEIGPNSLVMGAIRLTGDGDPSELFSIGKGCVITGNLHVDLGASVRIGDRVYIGHDVALLTVDHLIGASDQRCGPRELLPIVIEDGVWIGSRVTVLPGVTVGAGAVVATGAVVTRAVPPDTLVAGIPAKVVRELESGVPLSVRKRRSTPPKKEAGDGCFDPVVERTPA